MTMPSLEIFVIFHNHLYPENYAELTEEELKHITFVAVNPSIPKIIPPGYKVLNEWDLPIYDPTLQPTWKETSAIIHLYQNQRICTDFVGFAQYDMKFLKHSVSSILNSTISPNEGMGIRLEPPQFAFIGSVARHELATIHSIPTLWNGTKRVPRLVPLLNTYVISQSVYAHMMEFVLRLKRELPIPPNGSIAGIFERVTGYALSQLVTNWYTWNLEDLHFVQKHLNY